jgi:hypothetical protein
MPKFDPDKLREQLANIAEKNENDKRIIIANELANDPEWQRKTKEATSKFNKATKTGANNHWFGTNGPMAGKKHSEEAKRKSARIGEHNGMYGKGELVAGHKNGFYDKTHNSETIATLSEKAQNRTADHYCEHCNEYFTAQAYSQHHGDRCANNPNRIVTQRKKYKKKEHTEVVCPHCGKVGSGPNMTRYHFDNCKEKK